MQKEYNIIVMQYQESQFIETNCLDIEFFNFGTQPVEINNFPLDTTLKRLKIESRSDNEIIKEPIYIKFNEEVATRKFWIIKRVRINK